MSLAHQPSMWDLAEEATLGPLAVTRHHLSRGAWVDHLPGWITGSGEVLDIPDALEPLCDYYRSISGEHPDWDEYRAAMERQGKVLLRITIDDWGPVSRGGFPPRLLD